jgi:uncharacterized protein (DUF58 family)
VLVPSSRLLAAFALLVLPAAAVARYTGAGALASGWIGFVLCIFLLDAFLGRRRLAGIGVTGPELIRMWKGRESTLDLSVRNLNPATRRIRIGPAAPEALTLDPEELTITLAPSQIARLTWTATPSQRGRYSVERCLLETPSPLGFWAIRDSTPLTVEIRVYPDLSSAQQLSTAFLRRGHVGSHPQRQIGRGREFEKLREYSFGDGFDEVDWKATARRGRPITRVFQVERTQEVYVILDASRLTARPISTGSPDSILERNITAALLLALEAEKQGDHFGLITFSDRIHGFVRARGGKAHYGACREALFALQPRIVTPDFDELGTLLRLRLRRRALLVFLTELDDPILAESFLRNAGLIRRNHLMLVGMMQPPGSRPLFEDVISPGGDIYESLAGHMQWSKLRTFAKVLERQGIQFLLCQPDRISSQLASAYVNLKRRQAL